MNEHHAGGPAAADSAGRPESRPEPAGTPLGSYTTADGDRRHLRLIGTPDHGLCLVDAADEGAILVEPRLDDTAEARAIAADYLALASERGKPQTRHPWPPTGDSPERSRS